MPLTDADTGWKRDGTSREAAEGVAPKAAIVRARVLAAYHASILPLSADEVAKRLDLDPLTVRPRVSELVAKGRLADSGARTVGRFGRSQTQWRLA